MSTNNSLRNTCIWMCFLLILSFPRVAADARSSELNIQLQLERQKLTQEIKKLERENAQINSLWAIIPNIGTLIMALAAIIGAAMTAQKQIYETSRQRELDRLQRDTENLRSFDKKFTSVVKDLGSDSSSLRASAAISLIVFLRPEYQVFHEQVFLILLANIKIRQDQMINRLLTTSFEKAIRVQIPSANQPEAKPAFVDLSFAKLDHVDLSGLNLTNTDFAFAKLVGANLSRSRLFRAKGIKVNMQRGRFSGSILQEARFQQANFEKAIFHEANLVSVVLKGANLSKASFIKAKMQSAHLEDALFLDTHFEQADINDAFFYKAHFDQQTLESIIKAYNWEKAHFDKPVKEWLLNFTRKEGF